MPNRNIWLFMAAVIVVPLVAFMMVSWYQKNYSALPVMGGPQHRVGEFMLTDQHNKTVSNEDWKGKIVVADFFFTSCPTICPKMTKSLKAILATFPADSNLLMSSFSVDPQRDDPSKLAAYALKYNIKDRWSLLTGDKREIYLLARKSFMIVATDGDGGENDFIHSEKLVLVDKSGRIRGYYDGTSEAGVSLLINDIEKLRSSDN